MFLSRLFSRRTIPGPAVAPMLPEPPTPPARSFHTPVELNLMSDITRFIGRYPDEQLCWVLAFCEDGHMDYHDGGRCLLAVFSVSSEIAVAYRRTNYHMFSDDRVAKEAERAYFRLGYAPGDEQQSRRDRYLLEVLRAELERRDKHRLQNIKPSRADLEYQRVGEYQDNRIIRS
jgi:hypothetical protein